MNIHFSVLTYRPSFIANEKINVGVLFHNIDQNNVYLELTTNWTRIKNFDDEIEIDAFKLILEGMKKHAERNIKKLSPEKYIKRYNNELKFGKVMYKSTDNIDEFIVTTKQMFMPYDFEKSKRPNEVKQINYIKELLKDSKINYNTKVIKGVYEEAIRYDFSIGKKCFKLFEFTNNKNKKAISTAKQWAYTAKELKEEYETIFLYDAELENDIFNQTINILKSSGAKVMPKEEVLELILKNNSVE